MQHCWVGLLFCLHWKHSEKSIVVKWRLVYLKLTSAVCTSSQTSLFLYLKIVGFFSSIFLIYASMNTYRAFFMHKKGHCYMREYLHKLKTKLRFGISFRYARLNEIFINCRNICKMACNCRVCAWARLSLLSTRKLAKKSHCACRA